MIVNEFDYRRKRVFFWQVILIRTLFDPVVLDNKWPVHTIHKKKIQSIKDLKHDAKINSKFHNYCFLVKHFGKWYLNVQLTLHFLIRQTRFVSVYLVLNGELRTSLPFHPLLIHSPFQVGIWISQTIWNIEIKFLYVFTFIRIYLCRHKIDVVSL